MAKGVILLLALSMGHGAAQLGAGGEQPDVVPDKLNPLTQAGLAEGGMNIDAGMQGIETDGTASSVNVKVALPNELVGTREAPEQARAQAEADDPLIAEDLGRQTWHQDGFKRHRPVFDQNPTKHHNDTTVDGDKRHVRFESKDAKIYGTAREGKPLKAEVNLTYDLTLSAAADHGINLDDEMAVVGLECHGSVDTNSTSINVDVFYNSSIGVLQTDQWNNGFIINAGPDWGCRGEKGFPATLLRRAVSTNSTTLDDGIVRARVSTTHMHFLDLFDSGHMEIEERFVKPLPQQHVLREHGPHRNHLDPLGIDNGTLGPMGSTSKSLTSLLGGEISGVVIEVTSSLYNAEFAPGQVVPLTWSTQGSFSHFTSYYGDDVFIDLKQELPDSLTDFISGGVGQVRVNDNPGST